MGDGLGRPSGMGERRGTSWGFVASGGLIALGLGFLIWLLWTATTVHPAVLVTLPPEPRDAGFDKGVPAETVGAVTPTSEAVPVGREHYPGEPGSPPVRAPRPHAEPVYAPQCTEVGGYYRRNGTYVHGYTRCR